MKGPEFKINKPEIPPQTTPPELINDINKISSESVSDLKSEFKENKKSVLNDPFIVWLAKMGLKGETDFSHNHFTIIVFSLF